MFPRDFRTPKEGKIKIFLNLRGKRWANCGLPLGLASGLIGAYLGAVRGFPWGFRPHSPPT